MKRHLARTGALVLTLTIALSGGAAHASKDEEPGSNAKAKGRQSDHCISPSGDDINEKFGVDEYIVAPFCREVGSGQRFRPGGGWLVARTFEEAPEGFVPAGDTPLEDFHAKFEAVKYVIDAGTKHERVYEYTNTEDVWIGEFDGLVELSPLTLGTAGPLPVGQHTVDRFWVFGAMHCDGIDRYPDLNCFPAGETFYSRTPIEVTAGHN